MKCNDILKEADELGRKPHTLSRTMELISNFAHSSQLVKKILHMQSTSRGTVAAIRLTDGDAYEIEVSPFPHGDYYKDKRDLV